MIAEEFLDLLGPKLAASLDRRGFAELTAVQAAVLNPSLADCDLRITSQTGSGKTVAIGFALRSSIEANSSVDGKPLRPCAIIVVPTRELAKQVHNELTWLYAPFKIRLACVTGGSSIRDERRAFTMGPSVVIGTPGRLVDHLQRGAFDASAVSTIVLDEADRMLDLGFAEALEAIFAAAPNRKHAHLVSATLGPEVLRLANRFQAKPRQVQGTRPGESHADIEHMIHLVPAKCRVDALVNVLLAEPDERTLVFVRTRIDVATIAQELTDAGFRVATLSGDMEQPARDRALLAFRQDKVRVLVATDVAARGIDIQDMTRVIHFEPPTDPDSYTHRSGRTGRAGQKGSSIVFVAPERQRQLHALLIQARVNAKLLPLPDLDSLRRAADERMLKGLIDSLGKWSSVPRQRKLAEDLLRENDAASVVAMLIARSKSLEPEPRAIPEAVRPARTAQDRHVKQRAPRKIGHEPRTSSAEAHPPDWNRKALRPRAAAPTHPSPAYLARSEHVNQDTFPPLGSAYQPQIQGWGMFHVTWGQMQGADPRRMLAVVCRRGNIRGADVGAIRIGPTSTIIEVRNQVAAEFAAQARNPDPAEPRIRITELGQPNHHRGSREMRSVRGRA